MTSIRTSRLLLRPATMDDVEAMHEVLTNETAMQFWSTLPHSDIEQTRTWVGSMVDTNPEEGLDYIIEYKGKLIGKAGCWRMPEIGFIIHPDYWGQGFVSEALAAIIPSIFKHFPAPALEADVDPRNAGSLAVLKKLGFAETGRGERTMKLGDEWCDSVYLSLKRPS